MSTSPDWTIVPPPTGEIDWDRVAADLAPIRCERAPAVLKRKARDYFWFSPILKAALDDVRADLIAVPADVAELATVARYCFAHGLPLTPRGAGTGNYGQAMPLHGGIVVDLTRLDRILACDRDVVRAEAGAKLFDLERAAQAEGGELRFHPSTWKTASVGGFVAGGATGCGAINYGTLHSPGNVRALRVLTVDAEPALIELRDAAAQAAAHAYGTTGIIVEVELALAPARRWHDRIVAAVDLPAALALLDRIARDDAIGKKELGLLDAPVVALMRPLTELGLVGPLIVAMIDDATLQAFEAVIAADGATIVFARDPEAKAGPVPPMYELGWNHTTLHAIGRDTAMTYTQMSLPTDFIAAVLAIVAELGDETPMHLEMARLDGAVVCFGIPLLRFASETRLNEVHDVFRRHGCTIFNPHTVILETGGVQVADPAQVAFRPTGDPRGLLNPGKLPPDSGRP